MTAPDLFCPRCGGTLSIITDGLVGVPSAPRANYVNGERVDGYEWRWESRPFAACNGCEFCIQLHTTDLREARER